jgi:hypothetical protein
MLTSEERVRKNRTNDLRIAMAHYCHMLRVKERDAQSPAPQPVVSEEDLKFASQNQRLEGFPGEISEAARRHRPNWEELEAVARRFGAQMPKRPTDEPTPDSLKTPR